jgi:hypothetical protein
MAGTFYKLEMVQGKIRSAVEVHEEGGCALIDHIGNFR